MISKRKLSSLERFFYDRSRLNLHSCFFLGLQLNQLPDKHQIAHALRSTIANHPKLHQNVAIDPEDNIPYIKNVDTIKFDDVVEYVSWDGFDDNTICHIFQTYNFPYNIEKPLWKVLVYAKENRLLLLLDHALFDGMSAVIFWKSFMSSLSSDARDDFDLLYELTGDPMVQEDSHVYENWPTSWSSTLTKAIAGVIFKFMPSVITSVGKDQLRFNGYSFPDSLLTHKPDDDSSYEIRNNNRQLNLQVQPDHLNGILSACKSHQVSLTSFITALISVSLQLKIEDGDYSGSKIMIDIPMNTRGACADVLDIPDTSVIMGNFVAGLNVEYNLGESEELWQIARTVQAALNKQTKTDILETVNKVRLLDVADTTEFIRQKVKATGPSGTFEVTNLGFQEFADVQSNHGYLVEDAVFNEPQGLSDIFTCCIISTPRGGLNCSISYPRALESCLKPCFDYSRDYLEQELYQEKHT